MRWTLSKWYLFGSHARGTASEHSDVDLLVIERERFDASRSRRREMTRLWRLLARFPVPRIFSSTQWTRWSAGVMRGTMRDRTCSWKGRLLYERP